MKNGTPLSKLKAAVQQNFAFGPPNGWLLGWNAKRFESELAVAARPLLVENWTAFDYAFCNHYEVRLDSAIPNCYWVLTVLVSFVADYFCMHWTFYEGAGKMERSWQRRLTRKRLALNERPVRCLNACAFRKFVATG